MSGMTINIRLSGSNGLEATTLTPKIVHSRTSVEVRPILLGIGGDVDGGAVPAHVSEGLLTRLLDLAGGLDDGLHELQVGAAQLGLRGDEAGQQLTVLSVVEV